MRLAVARALECRKHLGECVVEPFRRRHFALMSRPISPLSAILGTRAPARPLLQKPTKHHAYNGARDSDQRRGHGFVFVDDFAHDFMHDSTSKVGIGVVNGSPKSSSSRWTWPA
jgi:hypothetical protein